MDDKDIDNVHAWRMLQKGKVSPEDAKRIFETHQAISTEESRKRYSVTTGRNLVLDMLIYREEIPRTKAFSIVAAVEGVSDDSTIRKPYLEWEKQDPDLTKLETERYYRERSNFITQAESDQKTARIQQAVKAFKEG